jgi:putative alpha-1,2-mannosidase
MTATHLLVRQCHSESVADVNSADDKQGGFASDTSDITGFSHMHDSGTGGGASLGNFPTFPQSGCPGDSINNCKFTKIDRAFALYHAMS